MSDSTGENAPPEGRESGNELATNPLLENRTTAAQRIWGVVKWLIAAIVIGWMFYSHHEQLLHLQNRTIHWSIFVAAIAAAFFAMILTFLRWYLLVKALDFPFTFLQALRLGFLGYACNFVALGATGGDVAKAFFLARGHSQRRVAAIATVVIDRVLGLIALFMVGALATLWPSSVTQSPAMEKTFVVLWGGTIAGLLGIGLLMIPAFTRMKLLQMSSRLPVVGHIAGELLDAAALYQDKPATVVASVVISLAGHLGILSSFWLCGEAFKGDHQIPGYVAHLQFVPIAELAGVINIFAPGGLGAIEGVMQYYYAAPVLDAEPEVIKAAEADGLITSIAYRVITVILASIGLIFYFSAKHDEFAVKSSSPPSQ